MAAGGRRRIGGWYPVRCVCFYTTRQSQSEVNLCNVAEITFLGYFLLAGKEEPLFGNPPSFVCLFLFGGRMTKSRSGSTCTLRITKGTMAFSHPEATACPSARPAARIDCVARLALVLEIYLLCHAPHCRRRLVWCCLAAFLSRFFSCLTLWTLPNFVVPLSPLTGPPRGRSAREFFLSTSSPRAWRFAIRTSLALRFDISCRFLPCRNSWSRYRP